MIIETGKLGGCHTEMSPVVQQNTRVPVGPFNGLLSLQCAHYSTIGQYWKRTSIERVTLSLVNVRAGIMANLDRHAR